MGRVHLGLKIALIESNVGPKIACFCILPYSERWLKVNKADGFLLYSNTWTRNSLQELPFFKCHSRAVLSSTGDMNQTLINIHTACLNWFAM